MNTRSRAATRSGSAWASSSPCASSPAWSLAVIINRVRCRALPGARHPRDGIPASSERRPRGWRPSADEDANRPRRGVQDRDHAVAPAKGIGRMAHPVGEDRRSCLAAPNTMSLFSFPPDSPPFMIKYSASVVVVKVPQPIPAYTNVTYLASPLALLVKASSPPPDVSPAAPSRLSMLPAFPAYANDSCPAFSRSGGFQAGDGIGVQVFNDIPCTRCPLRQSVILPAWTSGGLDAESRGPAFARGTPSTTRRRMCAEWVARAACAWKGMYDRYFLRGGRTVKYLLTC